MKILAKFSATLLALFLAAPVTAAPTGFVGTDTISEQGDTVLLAQRKRRRKGGKRARGVREKIISREARQKSSDSKNIDFDAVDIGGQRKTPLGTLVNQNKADKNYDFVKIRLRWHPEMVQSASALETGTTK